jgi:hypothetical protein
MNKESILEFDEKKLFNKDILQQYDEDGQKGFLGYLIRNKKWQIVRNKIVFPEIQKDEEIKCLLKDYDMDIMKNNLIIKKDILDKVFVLGFLRTKEIIDDESKEIRNREKKNKGLQR